MDLRKDNLGVEDVQKVVQGVGSVAKSIRDRAKAKKAQKISDAGGYLTLTPYQKSLIPVPAYITAANIPVEVAQKTEPIPPTTGQLAAGAKNNLLLVVAVIAAVGLAGYFIIKK